MISIRPIDVRHKSVLIRTLIAIADTSSLSSVLRFKGGTCAAMSDFLDRFSVDLDFDMAKGSDRKSTRQLFHRVFSDLGFSLDHESRHTLFFAVRYPSVKGERNAMKVSVMSTVVKANRYELRYLPEIDRTLLCQTKETMVANKLATPLDRYTQHKTIAGRDVYDIHYFLTHGYAYIPDILTERTGKKPAVFFRDLIDFIKHRVTKQVIEQDLNILLPYDTFRAVRGSLKEEVISLLEQEKAHWK